MMGPGILTPLLYRGGRSSSRRCIVLDDKYELITIVMSMEFGCRTAINGGIELHHLCSRLNGLSRLVYTVKLAICYG